MIDLLFISNGYGEDAIAAKIADGVSKRCRVAGFPLVGEGRPYRTRGIEVIGALPDPPGGGISLWKDMRGGLLAVLRKQWSELGKRREQIRHAVAVGDVFPAFLSHFALKRNFSFVGTAKSAYVQNYNPLERWVLRKAALFFARDNKTAEALKKKGIKAQWVGNPMMDEINEEKVRFPNFPGRTIAIFPGSRSESVRNFYIQVETLQAVARTLDVPLRGIALIPSDLANFLAKFSDWDVRSLPDPISGILGEIGRGDVTLLFVSNCIGDCLRASTVVLGQAGTANEQAAGAGKPVIAFDFDFYRNGKLSWYRWRQQKLLGKALAVTYPNAEFLAQKTIAILDDRSLYDEMSNEGKARMGPPGGAKKIADALCAQISAGP